MDFVDFLAQKKLINPGEVQNIRDEIQAGKSLDKAVADRGLATDALLEAKSEYYKIPIKAIGKEQVPFDILKNIPEESAVHYKMVPIGLKGGFLEVGMVNPDSIDAIDALNFISSKINIPYKVYIISEGDFDQVLEIYKGLSGEVTKALHELEETSGPMGEDEIEIGGKREGTLSKKETSERTIIEEAPVSKIVATILRYAVDGNASDVHIEPMTDRLRVRFRVDGVLSTSLVLPLKVHPSVVARIKILCGMRLDEKRKPQDGGVHARISGRSIDFRVSTFPAYYGEKIVMRILDQEKGVKKIDQIGLSERHMKMIRDALARPYGLILISGPTGSGKTTTLYSMLEEVDKEKFNVLSLEDPIEYNISGMSQSQVRPEIGYSFATGLRTTLRQDPDVIMVGEIRDSETAALAIQAALTGHLVFSTIHTNNSIGIIPRLIEMGVDPYLIPPTLVLGVAQRLVRKICPGSGKKIKVDGSIKMMVEKQFEDLPAEYRKEIPKTEEVLGLDPTPQCPNGTRGREAVFEMFEMDRNIEQVILKNPVDSEIYKAVRSKGMFTMKEDAIIKAFNKQIPFEEVNNL